MFRTDTVLPFWQRLALGSLPFILMIGMYIWGSYRLHQMEATNKTQATASSKLIPPVDKLWDGFVRSVIDRDGKGDNHLFADILASFRRFAVGMGIVALGIIIGLYMGAFPFFESVLKYFFVFADKIPPLLLLPILFIVFDVGEFSKIALIVIGVLPGVVNEAYQRTKEIRKEQFFKAQTLGASETEIAWSIILPQIWPKMLGALRGNFKAAWGYVIAGESIAASIGIGYRVFVMRRYIAMDVIIPYVVVATAFIFALDFLIQRWESRYRWANK